MYRASAVRENPRIGVVKAVLRTYIDILHIEKNNNDRLFAGTGALAAAEEEDMPGMPASQGSVSEAGSQVR